MNNISHLSPFKKTAIGLQFLFVAFGATVLVPILVGLDTSTALFCAGLGTLVFHLLTKGKVPIFLGSSFAFIAPIIKASELYGMAGTLSGIIAVGFVYIAMSILVKSFGTGFIKRLFPPVVIGPVIILIGISLAPTGVNMAQENWTLALVSLTTAVVTLFFGKGLIKLMPVLMGIIAGYIVAILFYDVDFTSVRDAAWVTVPKFQTPQFSLEAMLYMLPVAIAPIIEHIGDVYTISSVAKKDFTKDPGLHRTMLGDGVACILSGFAGGPPQTTYSEVTGAISLTKMTDPSIIRITAVGAILFSFMDKISAILRSIPSPILGGIMLLLFGSIASVGINNLVQNKVNMGNSRNTVIVSLTLTFGIGGATFIFGDFMSISGIGLSALIGVALNLILPKDKEEQAEQEELEKLEESKDAI